MPEPSAHRPTVAEIDLDSLEFNFRSVKNFVGEEIEYMSVVKADAYGHGSVECARRLAAAGTDWFGVAIAEEGIELRSSGITQPILCLDGFWSGQESDLIEHSLTPVVFRPDQIRDLNDAASKRGVDVNVHVKIDTGMGRVGVRPKDVAEFASLLATLPNVNLEGLMTHFAVADDLSQNDFTNAQIKKFGDAVETFHAHGFRPKYLDMANSPGAVAHPLSRAKMVRLGGVLYGLGGDVLPAGIEKPALRPVMAVRSAIALIKTIQPGETLGYGRTYIADSERTIATVPIGYHDGVCRSLSNRGKVIIKGVVAPMIGRVSMDWIIVDVTDVDDAKLGDAVTFIGSDGERSILAEDIARETGTISYEITCGINKRVPRKYTNL